MHALAPSDIFRFEGFRLDRRAGLFGRDDSGAFIPVAIDSRAVDSLPLFDVSRSTNLIARPDPRRPQRYNFRRRAGRLARLRNQRPPHAEGAYC